MAVAPIARIPTWNPRDAFVGPNGLLTPQAVRTLNDLIQNVNALAAAPPP